MTIRYGPFIRSMSGYSRSRRRTEVVAGNSVAARALPSRMAYTQIVRLPVSAALELRDRLAAVELDTLIAADHFHGTVTAAVETCTGAAATESSV